MSSPHYQPLCLSRGTKEVDSWGGKKSLHRRRSRKVIQRRVHHEDKISNLVIQRIYDMIGRTLRSILMT